MKKSAKTALLISACVAVPTIATICPIFYYVIKNHNLHKFRFNDLTNFQATKEEYILPTQTNTAHYFYEQCNSGSKDEQNVEIAFILSKNISSLLLPKDGGNFRHGSAEIGNVNIWYDAVNNWLYFNYDCNIYVKAGSQIYPMNNVNNQAYVKISNLTYMLQSVNPSGDPTGLYGFLEGSQWIDALVYQYTPHAVVKQTWTYIFEGCRSFVFQNVNLQ